MSNKIKFKRMNSLVWIIENFPSCPQEFEMSLDCPLFLCDGEVQIKLFPRGASLKCREFISCFLEMTNIGDVGPECKIEITDGDGNSFAVRHFYVEPCEEKVEVGFLEFVKIEEILDKIAKSKSDDLIVKCQLKNAQTKIHPIREFVARTLIGFQSCFFTWCIENINSKCSLKKIMYFPKCSKMEFNLIISKYEVEVAVLRWNSFDHSEDEFDRENDYGYDCEKSLVFKILFLTTAGKKLMAHQSWMDFDYHEKDSEKFHWNFEKDSLKVRSQSEDTSLKCEITISYGTYLRHINPIESSPTKNSRDKTS